MNGRKTLTLQLLDLDFIEDYRYYLLADFITSCSIPIFLLGFSVQSVDILFIKGNLIYSRNFSGVLPDRFIKFLYSAGRRGAPPEKESSEILARVGIVL